MAAHAISHLHRNPIVKGIRIAVMICGVLLAALLVDRIFFADTHARMSFFSTAPATLTLARGEIPGHYPLAVTPVDPDTPTARVVEGAPPESILAF